MLRSTLVATMLAVGVAASFIATAAGQGIRDGNLVVGNGQALELNSGRVGYFVETLTLGDGSRIVVPPATRTFVLHANRVNVGNGAAILARGRDGSGAHEPERDGPTIVLIFRELERVQGLHVASVGGDGVEGKPGKPGATGAEGHCGLARYDGDLGGKGGNGARGGDAGHGGKVFLVLPQDASGYGISMNTAPGEPGQGGPGGVGGRGGRGKICWKYPIRIEVDAGDQGHPGQPGPDGEAGRLGRFTTFTFDDRQHGAKLEDRLQRIVAILNDGGYTGDAEALRAVLGPHGLYRQ